MHREKSLNRHPIPSRKFDWICSFVAEGRIWLHWVKPGITVNKNGFGALPIQRIPLSEAAKLLRKAFENGITFFDTAHSYTDSEEKIGYALHDVRDQIFLATKTPSTTAEVFGRIWKQVLSGFGRIMWIFFQFHNPSFCPKPGDGTGLYEAMLEAKRQGENSLYRNYQSSIGSCDGSN